MKMNRFSIKVIGRIILILGNLLLIAYIFGDERLVFNQLILSTLLIIQIFELLRFINKTNQELAKFILAIKHGDFSVNFKKSKVGTSFDNLNEAFEEVIGLYKKAKIEKEAQYQYLSNIVSHLNIGIISVENQQNITLINESAEKLINLLGVKNWQILKEKKPVLWQKIEEMGDEGRRLIEFNNGKLTHTLSLDVSSVKLLDKDYKLITLQDIHSEIEQKEIEAWHKLIRILTHEIMNSATPISSLTETMQEMLKSDEVSQETLEDLRFSLKTIQRRSNGMLTFIDDYRKITKVPKPKPEPTNIAELFDQLEKLLKASLGQHQIQLSKEVKSPTAKIYLDPHLIEQVLINLIKNSQYALQGRENPEIKLLAYSTPQYDILEVRDNGKGIPEKEMQEIFIPFFTTRKEGSGIGLSLSKQIMHAHGGTIKVESTVDQGTTFFLQFRKND